MAFELTELPYRYDALEPVMSRETLEYHHDKHHQAYVNKANKLVADTEFDDMPIEEVLLGASGPIFNNVAQIWNHTFFWECLQTPGTSAPGKKLTAALRKSFGGVDDFKTAFSRAATELFGSGWVWLVRNGEGALEILSLQNAGNPLTQGATPLLTCDVWEHAYYIDRRNDRAAYLAEFWHLVNWRYVEENLDNAAGGSRARPAIALPQQDTRRP